MNLQEAAKFMPPKFVERFKEDFMNSEERELLIKEDPQMYGVYAIRVDPEDEYPCDLLWSHDDFEGCEFSSWPPTSSNQLHF